jgi:Ca2+-transporting ATPase
MRRKIALKRLIHGTEVSGLTDSQWEMQRHLYGDNAITERQQSAALELIKDTIKDPMIWFLMIAASLFLMIGQMQESVILLVAMIPLIGMDVFLHWRTSRSTRTLQTHLSASVEALRNGKLVTVPASSLVPGDLMFLKSNDFIPADGLFIQAEDVQIDESPLTGESLPIKKQPAQTLPSGAEPFVDAVHWGYAGTKMLSGTAAVKVAYTGSETLYGEIIQSVAATGHELTPLQKDISRLIKKLLLAALFFCIVLAIARIMEGKGIVDALIGAATLAVAAIPEEFPVVFTFYLGVGVYRMARRKALVRRAVSVENIGRVTCICSDKTGTITEGRLRLAHVKPGLNLTDKDLLEAAVLASREDSNDPIDQAIFEAESVKASPAARIALFPFTEMRRKETSALGSHDSILFFCKGSPEVVLALSELSANETRQYMELTRTLAREGHKVIGCARRSIPQADWNGEEPASGYLFLGLLAFEDPIRKEVPDAIKACTDAGIHVLMITGDHPDTATTVAREIGLGNKNVRLFNAENVDLSTYDSNFFLKIDVVARALPAQKLEIVSALKNGGEIVAVTGDGINDVPALKAADIGLAMGGRGTRAAREISSIVISDDNFATIFSAIAEGRQLLQNLRNSFQYLIAVHIPLVTTAAIIPLLGFPLLYLPIHIVWLELIIHPTALFAFQDRSSLVLKRLPRHHSDKTFSSIDWSLSLSLGVMTTIAIGIAYALGFDHEDEGIRSRSLAILTLIFSGALVAGLISRFRTRSSQLVVALTVLTSFLLITGAFAQDILHLTPLRAEDWMTVTVLSCFATMAPYTLMQVLGKRLARTDH